jgi:hypothetical protein
MLTCLIQTQHNQMKFKVLWTNIQWNFNLKKLQQFMDPILITYGQMHPLNNTLFGVVEAYWIDHKPIYFAFKFLDYVPQYHHIGKK